MPIISVVMGVYNGSEHLEETIESVLCQTDAVFEFIVVNDGSKEAAAGEVLSDYARRDGRIRVITKSNEGLTKALIYGCAAAKGKYIARIDNGDVMLPERLAKQMALLDEHPESVLATCWTEFCGPEWESLFKVRNTVPGNADNNDWVSPFPDDGDDRDKLLGPTHHGSVMFRRDAYMLAGGYRAAFYYGQDWDLWYRLADTGKFAGIQEVLYRCRISPDGISMRNAERQRQIHACSRGAFLARRRDDDETPFLERAASIRPGMDNDDHGHKSLPAQHAAEGYYFIGEALRQNCDQRCRKYYTKAFCITPWRLKICFRWFQSYCREASGKRDAHE